MKEAYRVAGKNAGKSAASGKKYHDKRIFGANLRVGDRVLVRNLSERGGTGKLRSYWEPKVHKVVRKKENIPVYSVCPEDGTGKERVLHRNLLMSCDHLPYEEPPVKVKKKKKIDKMIASKTASDVVSTADDGNNEEEDEDWRMRYMLAEYLQNENMRIRDTSNIVLEDIEEVEDEDEVEIEVDDSLRSRDTSVVLEDIDEDDIIHGNADVNVDSDSASGDTQSSDESDGANSNFQGRSRRERRPPKLFTYDKIGKPSIRSIVYQ